MKPLACHTKGIHASGYAKIHGVKPCIFFMQIHFLFFGQNLLFSVKTACRCDRHHMPDVLIVRQYTPPPRGRP